MALSGTPQRSSRSSRNGTVARQPPPVRRVLLLPLLAFAVALVIHAALAALGMSSANPVRVFATPVVGALIVYFGLPGYPRAGRLRLAAMVAVGLLLIALVV